MLPNLQLPTPFSLPTLNRKLADIYKALFPLSKGTTGEGLTVRAGAPSLQSIDVTDGRQSLAGALDIGFVVQFQHVGGVIHHMITSNAVNATPARTHSRIVAASPTSTATPLVDAVTPFAAGVGIDAASPYFIVFDTAEQIDGDESYWSATYTASSLGFTLLPKTFISNIKINGVQRRRLAFYVTKNDGSNFAIDPVNIPGPSNFVALRFRGNVR